MPKWKRGGKRAAQAQKPLDLSRYNINYKKFDEREKQNLVKALTFMEGHFGDISEYAGTIKKKYLKDAAGEHDHGYNGQYYKRERYTAFDTSGFATPDTMVHEFTHAVAEELADHHVDFGFKSRKEFFESMRSEAYKAANMQERKFDGRKWADRATEFPSRQIETVYDFGEGADALSDAALQVLKRYWQQYKSK